MIDIKFLRENPDIVKENIKKKYQNHKLTLVDEVIKTLLDDEYVSNINDNDYISFK
jgi:seryl-tRNA synthetase